MKVGGLGTRCEAVADSYGDFLLRDVEPDQNMVLVERDGDIAVWKARAGPESRAPEGAFME